MTSVHAEAAQSNQGMLGIDNHVSSEQSTNALANEGRALDPHTSIPEEDESNETASETQEPITPLSDSANTDFHHHEGNGHIDPPPPTSNNAQPNTDMKLSTPFGPASKPVDIPRSSPQPQKQAPAATMTPQREGLGRRVGSFVKKGLSRTKSNTNGVGTSPPKQNGFTPAPSNPPSAAAQARERPSLDTTVLPVKPRRFSSFSLSGRNTPVSQSTSPPSPLSPSSTINSEHQSTKAPSGHKYSRSHTGFNGGTDAQEKPRQGITWGLNYQRPTRGEGPQRPRRRRSASQEIVPSSKRTNSSSDDSEEGPRLNTTLYSTFSKHADEGTGLKARRLSTSLPDEFMLDFCELKKEFKKVRPIKRKRVGQGATASVFLYECKDSNDHRLYAVKQFRTLEKGEDENEYQQKVKSEYSIAKSLHHPNIVETVRLCTEHDRWNHVMEYCDYGEIFTLVQKGLFFKHYKYEDRMCFFKQLLRGVCYLHDHGIAHRDIKLENLLMNKAGHLKISDFGVSECFSGIHPGLRDAGGECGKNMGEIRPCNPGICGSLPYIAPEVLAKKGPYDPRPLDVWSCAIAFITMSFGGSPWNAANKESDQYRKYKEAWDKWLETHPDGQITDTVDGTPKAGKLFNMLDNPALKRLMLKMLNPDPSKRVTIQEVVNSNIMKSVECCTPEDFDGPDTCGIDASGKTGAKSAMKMKVQKKHNHLPPKEQPKAYKILKHRFDMGDGWS